MKSVLFFLFSQFFLFHIGVTQCLQLTGAPPLLDVPTYSLATKDADGNTGMNILTYATPISIKPDRIWSLGLYKGTVAHENFQRSGKGVLQLLSPSHAKLVKLLGGSSGRDVNKKDECEKLGFTWVKGESSLSASSSSSIENDDLPDLLPDCIHYMKLRQVGDLIDCGSHDLAICKVESMFVSDGTNIDGGTPSQNLNTGTLRDLGIITEQGRVAE